MNGLHLEPPPLPEPADYRGVDALWTLAVLVGLIAFAVICAVENPSGAVVLGVFALLAIALNLAVLADRLNQQRNQGETK